MPRNVFILDDEVSFSGALEGAFGLEGHVPHLYEPGEPLAAVFDRFYHLKPALLIIEPGVRGFDVFELIYNLRADNNFSSLPIFVYGRAVSSAEKEVLSNHGVEYFFNKKETTPLDLLAKIKVIFKNKINKKKHYAFQ